MVIKAHSVSSATTNHDAPSDVTAWPGSRRPAQAEPCEAKLYEAPAGLPGARGSGFTFSKPQAVA